MRILFLNPPGLWGGLNVGLGYLSACCLEKGHLVKVLVLKRGMVKNLTETIKSYSPDVVGISVMSSTWRESLRWARDVKKMKPNIPLIVGGVHATICQEGLLNNKLIDIVVIGEGEETFPVLLDHLDGDLYDVRGIAFRDGERVIKNPLRGFVRDLDNLPFPEYRTFGLSTIKCYPLLSSRGCPYSCIFCSVGIISGKEWRAQSPRNLIAELERAKNVYRSTEFSIIDDNFTLNIERAKKFCDLMIERGLNMKWFCDNGIRADRLDRELALKMKEAGCERARMGIETPVPAIFKNIKKGETLNDIQRAIRYLKEANIEVGASFIIGLPGDSLENVIKSIRIVKGFQLNEASWNLLVPYPGTEIEAWAQKNGRTLRSYIESTHHAAEPKPAFETQDFTELERIQAYKMANIKFGKYFPFYHVHTQGKLNKLSILFQIIKLVIKYDAVNLPQHFFSLYKDYILSYIAKTR